MRQVKEQKKIVFIIPGFRQKPTQIAYRNIAKLLRQEAYFPVRLSVTWKDTTLSENIADVVSKIKKKVHGKEKIYLLGFSYGAMIAFLAATKIPVKGLILCSLSPFFKEDLVKLPISASDLQKKRHESFSLYKAKKVAQKVKAKKVMMFYGANESKPLIARVKKTFRHIPISGKYLLSVQNVEHNIADKKYMTAIHYATKTFL